MSEPTHGQTFDDEGQLVSPYRPVELDQEARRDGVTQRAWDVIAEVRDRAPRLPNDVSTDAIVKALCDAGLLAERPAEPDLFEALAAVQHDIWSHWMKYLVGTKATTHDDGTVTLAAEDIEHWRRQWFTPYRLLTEAEKESDREQVRKFWPLLAAALAERPAEPAPDLVAAWNQAVAAMQSAEVSRGIHDWSDRSLAERIVRLQLDTPLAERPAERPAEPAPDLVAAFMAAKVLLVEESWRKPFPPEAKRMAAVAQPYIDAAVTADRARIRRALVERAEHAEKYIAHRTKAAAYRKAVAVVDEAEQR